MSFQPFDLGGHVGWVEDDAGAVSNFNGREPGYLVLGAPVHPDQTGMHGEAIAADGNAAIELTADA